MLATHLGKTSTLLISTLFLAFLVIDLTWAHCDWVSQTVTGFSEYVNGVFGVLMVETKDGLGV